MHATTGKRGKYRVKAVHSSLYVTQDDIKKFLESLKGTRTQGTIDEYGYAIRLLYEFLPADKCISPHTLSQWREAMLKEKYSHRTINARISAANSFLIYCGKREWKLENQLEPEVYRQPELTRNEYLRLLQAAKLAGKEREYLLIKLFACTGIAVKDISRVTVDAVRSGVISVGSKSGKQMIRIPVCLQKEMLEFTRGSGITSGKIFLTRKGTQMRRTNIADNIRLLCQPAQVPEEKGNPRCLRKLYQDTQESIRQNIEVLVDQAYIRMLENEQLTIGWDDKIAL
mgnify:FL=1